MAPNNIRYLEVLGRVIIIAYVHTGSVHTPTIFQFGVFLGLRYSCWCVYPLECTHSVYSVHTVCTHTVYTRQQSYNLAFLGAGTVRRHCLSARRMATLCIRSSSTCSGFSIQMFLRSQISPFFENLTTFLKVPDRFSTSWNSELLFELQPYCICNNGYTTQQYMYYSIYST